MASGSFAQAQAGRVGRYDCAPAQHTQADGGSHDKRVRAGRQHPDLPLPSMETEAWHQVSKLPCVGQAASAPSVH